MSKKVFVKGYQVGALIDQSGLRNIYRAIHLRSRKEMFLTVISVRAGRSLMALQRRAEMSKRLTLKGLEPAFEYGVLANEKFFFSHQAAPSFAIKRILAEIPDTTERLYTLLRYFLELLDLVDYIHEAGTTHRDLNTAQVRICHKGPVLLEGFINARPKVEPRNIANIVNLPYMSPEQLSGSAKADRKTDIYSLGVILFELLSGKLPYDSNHTKLEDIRQGIVPTPTQYRIDIPYELEACVMKALAPRGSRYRSIQEFSMELQAFYRKRSVRNKLKDVPYLLRRLLKIKSA